MKRHVELYLTGFGPFGKVADNPTKYIVLDLKDFHCCDMPDVSIKIIDHLLEVKAHEAESFLEKLYARIYQEACSDQNHSGEAMVGNGAMADATVATHGSTRLKKLVLVIHFGVCEEGKRIKLEKCAVNDATFRIPDMSGWQPSHGCVCSDDPRMQVLDTSVPVDKVIDMVGEAEKKEECLVESSTDAGRFVCNFVYYWSLKKARQTRQKMKGADVDVKSLFIHVPMFSVMDFPLQSRVVRLVLQVLLESELGSASTLTGNIDL